MILNKTRLEGCTMYNVRTVLDNIEFTVLYIQYRKVNIPKTKQSFLVTRILVIKYFSLRIRDNL